MSDKKYQSKLGFTLLFIVSFMLFFSANVSAATTFTDLEKVPWAEEEIYYLNEQGIIGGYGNGKFGPSDRITRGQAAAMLVRDLYPNQQASSNPGFEDVETDDYFYHAIALAAEKGLFNGYTDNTFRSDAYISRAETAVVIDSAYGVQQGNSTTSFSDVKSGVWYTGSIKDLASQNIINGYPDDTFKPGNKVTRAEFSVVLAKTLSPDLQDGELTAHFLDVGQGDSALLETPSGKTILIDGGRKSAGQKIVDYLAQAGITSIDLLVATHPDADHIGGLIDVLEQVEVKRVLDSGKTHTTDTYMEYLTLIDEKDIPFATAETGESISLDSELDIQVLNGLDSGSDLNDSSVVLKVSHGTVDFMLTGDASVENEESIIQQFNAEAEILKVGHHGSSTSTSQALLDEVDPEVGILSYGENNYGHPDADVVNRLQNAGTTLYSTYAAGDILVTSDGTNFDVSAQPWEGDVIVEPAPDDNTPFPVNVNTAGYDLLQEVNGIGPTIAQNIIDYRNANGPFQTIEELTNVSYIGPATLEKIRPYITL